MTVLNITLWYMLIGSIFSAWVFHWAEEVIDDAAGVVVCLIVAANWPIGVLIVAGWLFVPVDEEGDYAADHDDL